MEQDGDARKRRRRAANLPVSTSFPSLVCADIGKSFAEFSTLTKGKSRKECEFFLGERLAIALPRIAVDQRLLEEQRQLALHWFGKEAIELPYNELARHLRDDSYEHIKNGRPVPILSPAYHHASRIFEVVPASFSFPTVSRGAAARPGSRR